MAHYDDCRERFAENPDLMKPKPYEPPKPVVLKCVGDLVRDKIRFYGDNFKTQEIEVYPETISAVIPWQTVIKHDGTDLNLTVIVSVPFSPAQDNAISYFVTGTMAEVRKALDF